MYIGRILLAMLIVAMNIAAFKNYKKYGWFYDQDPEGFAPWFQLTTFSIDFILFLIIMVDYW